MPRWIYLLWAPGDQHRDGFCERLLDELPKLARNLGAHRLTLQCRDSDARVRSPSTGCTGRAPFDALLSLTLDDPRKQSQLELALEARADRVHGYAVDEMLYTDYGGNRHARARDWPDGERSPGVVSVTLLERPRHVLYADWIAHWHGRQSPLSELMQPRTRYVRSVVTRCLTPGAPIYGGIVEEAWPSARHVEDPYLFYCAHSLEGLAENMGAMLRSVTSFLELPRIQTVMTSEYFLLSDDS
ncbi:MAG: hypothetical protein QM778_03575 [Myxococcales bacterium]